MEHYTAAILYNRPRLHVPLISSFSGPFKNGSVQTYGVADTLTSKRSKVPLIKTARLTIRNLNDSE